jgi:predicted nucleic acid-binding protein
MEGRPIVIDANVLVYMLLEGEKSDAARRLHDSRPDWLCPSILRHEFMNVCATYQRAGGLSREECLIILAEGVALLHRRELEVDPYTVLGAAIDFGLSAYDAQYVAAAVELEGVLVTEDRVVLTRVPSVARSLDDYLNDRDLR